MSSPWRRTFPSALAFGIVSCIRFRQRMRVDFPHPDGPMIAVTSCSSKSIVMSSIAFFAPYQADSRSIWIFAAMAASLGHGPEVDDRSGHDADDEHDKDEDEERPPGVLEPRGGPIEHERVDRVGQGLDRLVEAGEAVEAPVRGHEERGR